MSKKDHSLKLSIIIPVYNEKDTIQKIIYKVKSVKLGNINKQIIVVDDCSTDGTTDILKKIKNNEKAIEVIFKTKNEGKGAAIKTAIPYIKGEVTLIQDADLEYDPEDIPKLLRPILYGQAEVTYG
jgi:glycosyltransferase involved in cell wall biosynthesis